MTLEEIYQIVKRCKGVSTDSRQCGEGWMFVALRGERFDGNNFAAEALEQCAYAIVDREPESLTASEEKRRRMLYVPNTLQTYKALARLKRKEYNIPVVAVTGTNGKTTTKELISSVLRERYKVLATEGNYNNDIGVPKTLFALSEEKEIAVVEMGASHRGDIRSLVETALPTCGLITNVGRAHLEGFGDFEGVKAAKGELYDYLAQSNAFAFVNERDALLRSMAQERGLRSVAYVRGQVLSLEPELTVELEGGEKIHTQLIGAYNLANVLAAVTVGQYFCVEREKIISAIEGYEPHNNRSQRMLTAYNELIVDAYNANPSSMSAAIENFAQLSSDKEKMLILGDMAELGSASKSEHQSVVDELVERGFAFVWLVGKEFKSAHSPFSCFTDVAQVKDRLHREPLRNRCILIKGSNSMKLSSLVEEL